MAWDHLADISRVWDEHQNRKGSLRDLCDSIQDFHLGISTSFSIFIKGLGMFKSALHWGLRLMNLLSTFAVSRADEAQHSVFSLKDAREGIVYLFRFSLSSDVNYKIVTSRLAFQLKRRSLWDFIFVWELFPSSTQAAKQFVINFDTRKSEREGLKEKLFQISFNFHNETLKLLNS